MPPSGCRCASVFSQRLRRRPGQHAPAKIEAAVMARTPNDGLPRLKRDGATFVGALRAKREAVDLRLQNDHALTAHRNDDKFVLLQLGGFIAGQTRRSGGTGLRQRLEITNQSG